MKNINMSSKSSRHIKNIYSKTINHKEKNIFLENDDEQEKLPVESFLGHTPPNNIRLLMLYGEINESKAEGICYALQAWKETKRIVTFEKIQKDALPKKAYEIIDPLNLIINTPGGSSADMFSIYDQMRLMKKEGLEIRTFGLGKVMSAGVLLLATRL